MLFDLVMDVLSRLIERKVHGNELDTYKVNGTTSISHLMYAEDILLFCKANPRSLLVIKDLLHQFSEFTGLQVNAQKSSIILTKACQDDNSFSNNLDFTRSNLPITYLGLPITGKKKSHSQGWKLIQPIENMLSHWNGKCLSYGERIQLVKWIIVGKYTYWAQGISLPSSIHKKVQKLAYQFIWDGRKGIPWDLMVLPKDEGGLGIRNLQTLARAAPIKKTKSVGENIYPCQLDEEQIQKG